MIKKGKVAARGLLGSVHQHIGSNVVGYVALFVALSGTAYASVIITSNRQVAKGTISGHKPPPGDHPNLIAGSVSGKDLAGGAVTGGKLAANAVDGSKVIDGSLTGTDVQDGSLTGTDVQDGSLTGTDVQDGSLTGADVQDNSLTGADISAGTLGEVPSATIGGLGRSTGGQSCDPSGGFIDCAITTINLPRSAKVLLIGHAMAQAHDANAEAVGDCKLVTEFGDVSGTSSRFVVQSASTSSFSDNGTMSGITGALGPGSVDFGIDCDQVSGNIVYSYVSITAVAISPN